MLSWVVQNFILVIYSNATQLTYSLIGLLAMARRVIWIRSVRPSAEKFSWNWLFSFFSGTRDGLRGPCGVVYDCQTFSKKCFTLKTGKIGKVQGIWMYRKVQFFFLVLNFLSVWSIMKVCITVISVCLNRFYIWKNSGFWDMAQNALGQSDCRIFQSIAGL